MPEQHLPCRQCGTTDPDLFERATSAFCSPCWAEQVNHGKRFNAWAENARREARGFYGPFFA